MRQYLSCASRESLARCRDLHMQRPTINLQNPFFQNLITGQRYEPRIIYLPASTCLDFPNMAIYSRGITLWWRPQAPAYEACPWEHRLSSSAPCAVPWGFLGLVNTSRTRILRNNERYSAFHSAVLAAFLKGTISCSHFLIQYL